MIERRRGRQKITFDDTCFLVSESLTSRDELGNKIVEKRSREVFCNFQSVGSSQFFDASARGYKLSFVVTINDFEYEGEPTVEIEGNPYEVVRTYLLDGGLLELTVGEKIGDRA